MFGFNCLGVILTFLLLLLFFKFGFFILIIFLILWVLGQKVDIFKKPKMYSGKGQDFEVKPGKVYKECSFCNAKSERNLEHCPNCGKPI